MPSLRDLKYEIRLEGLGLPTLQDRRERRFDCSVTGDEESEMTSLFGMLEKLEVMERK